MSSVGRFRVPCDKHISQKCRGTFSLGYEFYWYKATNIEDVCVLGRDVLFY